MFKSTLRLVLLCCFAVLMAPAVVPYIVDFAAAIADRPDGAVPTASGYRAEMVEAPLGGGRSVALRADGRGHFEADAKINNQTIPVMVDTGATSIALRFEDAQRLGLRPMPSDFTVSISTANGVVKAARVTLDEVRVGDVRVRAVEALVVPAKALGANLLGMSFIRRLSKMEMKGDRLVLTE